MHKTLVLSSVKSSPEKAVAHIQTTRLGSSGSLRLYNFRSAPDGILSLGVLDGDKVKKAGLVSKGTGVYEFEFSETVGEIFSCALVQIHDGKVQPILIGNSKAMANEKLIKGLKLIDEECLSVSNTEEVLDELGIDFEDEEKEEIEKEIDAFMDEEPEEKTEIYENRELESCQEKNACEKAISYAASCASACADNCSECQYRKAFFDVQTRDASSEQRINENEYDSSFTSENPFYFEIKEQLQELFEKHPADAFLTASIPNSKWVKVDYENQGKFYVVGLLYDDGNLSKVRFVCYGVPGDKGEESPRELGKFCRWFPLVQNNH